MNKKSFRISTMCNLRKIFTALTDEEWWAFKKDRRKNQRDYATAARIDTASMSKIILNSIDRCTGERKYIISDLLKTYSFKGQTIAYDRIPAAGRGFDAIVGLCDKSHDELYSYGLVAGDENEMRT